MKNLIIRVVTKGLEYGTILSMAGITIILSLNVILRYLFSRPFHWAEEISVLLIVWVVLLGAGLVQQKDGHVAISYLFDLFPVKWKIMTLIFGNLCICAVLAVHLLSAINLLKLQMTASMISVNMSSGFFALAVLVGIAAMLLFTIDSTVKGFKNRNSFK
jgi:TRAP-type C4-dicarboxylate transport system permease small subunit